MAARRYLFVSFGGWVLAVVTMGIYSFLLFASTFVFFFLEFVGPDHIHSWVFGMQMLWQTFWHLLIQYREHYLQEPISIRNEYIKSIKSNLDTLSYIRLFMAVSSLMLLTQRMTSVSMDFQEEREMPFDASSPGRGWVLLLPLSSYVFSFTMLLGGPLCSYSQFVSLIEGIGFNSPANPLGVVSLKVMQVLLLEGVRYCLVYLMKHDDPSNSRVLCGIYEGLAAVLRIRYYSHWSISECLNNAAGLLSGNSPDWSVLSDGDLWTTETSSRVSEFARRWNSTTALWLRRLVFLRCKTFPLLMTLGFSVWWHGLHLGPVAGFWGWAAAVNADYLIHRYLVMLLNYEICPA
ncbi:LOW QUALITY PROTEIN: ghrelin O-acyltransferase [Diretmus argenteus]